MTDEAHKAAREEIRAFFLETLGRDIDRADDLRCLQADMHFLGWLRKIVLTSGIAVAAAAAWFGLKAWIKSLAKGNPQ